MNGCFYIHANKHFVDHGQNTVSNEVCGFYFQVFQAIMDDIKASIQTIGAKVKSLALSHSSYLGETKDDRKE